MTKKNNHKFEHDARIMIHKDIVSLIQNSKERDKLYDLLFKKIVKIDTEITDGEDIIINSLD